MFASARSQSGVLSLLAALVTTTVAHAASIEVFVNAAGDYDYARQLDIPPGFGVGEFTLEVWLRPNHTFPVGPTPRGTAQQRTNWASADNAPYSSSEWWFEGNFLLDGHNNGNTLNGTFSLQFYGGGRVRWLFGDGTPGLPGDMWSVGVFPAANTPSLLDGQWHQVTLLRRWSGTTQATLEMYIDGAFVAAETTNRRTNMRTFWDGWPGYIAGQQGWFWAAEKHAVTSGGQWEDYKGLIDEMRFWSRAKTSVEIASSYDDPVVGNEPGLVGNYRFEEGAGTSLCDSLSSTRCMTLVNPKAGVWSSANAPLASGTPDTTAPSVPGGLQATSVLANRVDLAWTAATDNVGVTGYRVLRDGAQVGLIGAVTTFADTTVAANTTYVYSVTARDAAGNESAASATLSATTPPATTVPGTLQFSDSAFQASEGAGQTTLTVTRTGGTDGAVTVQYQATAGTARTPADFTAASGTLSWGAGQGGSRTFSLAIVSDSIDEPNETVNLSLSGPTGGASLGTSSATLTIVDDDPTPPPPAAGALQFSASTFEAAEGVAQAAITVTRTGGSTGEVLVSYQASAGTATAPADFATASGSLRWVAGETGAKTFTVAIVDDSIDEPDETVNLDLSNPTGGASLGVNATATLTLTDNDPPAGPPPPPPPTQPVLSGGGGGAIGWLAAFGLFLLAGRRGRRALRHARLVTSVSADCP